MNNYLTTKIGALGIGVGLLVTASYASAAHAVATLPSTDQIFLISCDPSYDDLTLFSVEEDGTATAIGNGNGNLDGKCPWGATWDAKNQSAYFLTEDSLTNTAEIWTMDIDSGTPTKVSDIVGGEGFYIHFNSEGEAQTQYDGVFYDLDLSTYTESELTSSSVNQDNSFYYITQAFNYATNTLYAINADDTEDDADPINNMLYEVDPETGVVFGNTGPHISGLEDVGDIGSIAFDSSGTGWAIVGEDLYSFDVATATFTLQGAISDGSRFMGSSLSLFIAQAAPESTLANTGFTSMPLVAGGVLATMFGVALIATVRRRTRA